MVQEKRDSNGFDEQFYLNRYLTYKRSLDNGDYENAYEHFKNFGINENYHPFAKILLFGLMRRDIDLKLRRKEMKKLLVLMVKIL
ncbi:MAG: hypothetical protein CM15mP109_08430 [Candidatus Dadabacteria bacterium]|nr:MAG: hypothetical protein CM15mP109_08430 [Candidatus Dadabacteria bacterium]